MNIMKVFLFFLLIYYYSKELPLISNISISNDNNFKQFSKIEITFNIIDNITKQIINYSNPFDEQLVNVTSIFQNDNNEILLKIYCFPYIPFILIGNITNPQFTQNGSQNWMCRFTPTQPSIWYFSIYVEDINGNSNYSSSLQVQSSSLPGFVRISSKDKRYFIRDNNNSTFFPIGEDVAWADNPFWYERYISHLSKHGASYIRVWLSETFIQPWNFALQTIVTGLGDFTKTQFNAWLLDYIVQLCETYNITMLLTFHNSGDWAGSFNQSNPFSAKLGGPLNSSVELWNSSIAQFYMNRLHKYIVSRWGYSTSIFAWELFNEVDYVQNGYQLLNEIGQWHILNSKIIRSFDAYDHLITTSIGSTIFLTPLSLFESMNFTQIHDYNAPDMVRMVENWIPLMISNYPNKPTFFGEYGLENGNYSCYADPTGISLHNEQWASLMSGAGGGGFNWWWDSYVDVMNLYYQYQGISSFVSGEQLDSYNYQTVSPIILLETPQYLTNYTIIPNIWEFIKPPVSNFTITTNKGIVPSELFLSVFEYGSQWNVQLRNPPNFYINCPYNKTEFIVEIGSISANPIITLVLDGNIILNQSINSFPYFVNISIPLGEHILILNSTGTDFFTINSLIFTHFQNPLRALTLQGFGRVLGWIQLTTNTWSNRFQNIFQPTLSNIPMILSNLSHDGIWELQWWNTTNGEKISSMSSNITVLKGNTTIILPTFNPSTSADWAFKLIYQFPIFNGSSTTSPFITSTTSITTTSNSYKIHFFYLFFILFGNIMITL